MKYALFLLILTCSIQSSEKRISDAAFLQLFKKFPRQADFDTVKTAIENGANTQAVDVYDRTILHLACTSYLRKEHQIEHHPFAFVLALSRLDLLKQDKRNGKTILHLLIEDFEYVDTRTSPEEIRETAQFEKKRFQTYARTLVTRAPALKTIPDYLGRIPLDIITRRFHIHPDHEVLIDILMPTERLDYIIKSPLLLDAIFASNIPLALGQLRSVYDDRMLTFSAAEIQRYYSKKSLNSYRYMGRLLLRFLEVKKCVKKFLERNRINLDIPITAHAIAWQDVTLRYKEGIGAPSDSNIPATG